MLIERKSPVTGIKNILDINISLPQYSAWMCGELLQEIAPQLTADEREFLISGCTPQDWDDLFAEGEE